MKKQQFGVVGLGVMGQNLALNIARNGYSVAGMDLDPAKVKDAQAKFAGSDIVAAVARKRWKAKPGTVIIMTDFVVICIAGIILQIKGLSPEKPVVLLMLYSFLLLIVSSQLIDIIILGFDYAKSAFIISDKNEEIAKQIMHGMGRGVTAFHGRGLYRGVERDILFTVVSPRENHRLVDEVREIDPEAFVIINRVHEVLGEGFMARGEVDMDKLKFQKIKSRGPMIGA